MKGKGSLQQKEQIKAKIEYIKVPKPKEGEKLLITFDKEDLPFDIMRRFAQQIVMKDIILIPKNMGFKLSVEKNESKN